MKFRLVKENKDSFDIIFLKDNTKLTITREEFDRALEATDKEGIYQMKQEAQNKVKRASELINEAIVASTIGHSTATPENTMTGAMMLSGVCEEYCKIMDCAPADFIRHVQVAKKRFMENSINKMGVGFDEKSHKVPKKLKKKNKENIAEQIVVEFKKGMSKKAENLLLGKDNDRKIIR